MKISVNWLKDYIQTDSNPDDLAKALTMSGSEVEKIHNFGDDRVFELEITPNRPDCLSHIGLAREMAAIEGRTLILPKAYTKKFSVPTGRKAGIKIYIEDTALCSYYSGQLIHDTHIKQAPEEPQRRLAALGLRSINNAVDITNFCLFECGQPMHVFDADKIRGKAISVRKAREGEKIVTIDDVCRTLTKGMLVIADSSGPIAIAGVMGGKETEVTEKTKNILLESAYFDPASIRKTSRTLGLTTDSSYRFERGVNEGYILSASRRATEMMLKCAEARKGAFVSSGTIKARKRQILLNLEEASKILGIELKSAFVTTKLGKLGLKRKSKEGAIVFDIPSFRRDLNAPADLIEEIARIYGYDNIPTTIPRIVGETEQMPRGWKVAGKTREMLIGCGFYEILSYSLISERELNAFGLAEEESVVRVKQPLSNEHAVLRPTLLAGALQAIDYNIRQNNEPIRFFEINQIYSRVKKGSYNERKNLMIAESVPLAGRAEMDSRAEEEIFLRIKGAVELLCERLGIDRLAFAQEPRKLFEYGCSVILKGENIGYIGSLDATVCKTFGVKEKVLCAEIDFEILLKHFRVQKSYTPISKYQAVSRDMSLVVDKKTPYDDLKGTILNEKGLYISEVQYLSSYAGKEIPQGKRNLLIRVLYHHPEKTLTDSETNLFHENLKEKLARDFDGLHYR